jgi:hypothetical protein
MSADLPGFTMSSPSSTRLMRAAFAIGALVWMMGSALGCDTRVTPSPTATPSPLPAPNMDEAYGRDVERVCFAERLSGALERPAAERMIVVADWLGRVIETEKGRAFLAEFARVEPADKPAFLDRAAREVGLAQCPLAATWSKANASTSGP